MGSVVTERTLQIRSIIFFFFQWTKEFKFQNIVKSFKEKHPY